MPRTGEVLLVTRNFPPLVGGMENVNHRLASALAETRPVVLVGPAGCAESAQFATVVSEAPLRPLWRFLLSALHRTCRLAVRRRPYLILAGSGLTLPIAWLAARLSGAKVAAYLHGLDIIADHAVYRALWPRFIPKCDFVFVNSRHTAGLAVATGVAESRVFILNPGTDVPEPGTSDGSAFRRRYGLADAPLLLSVGRLTRRKGLAEFVGKSFPAILSACPDARLVIVGEEATDALNRGRESEVARIQQAADAAGVSGAILFVGRQSGAHLVEAYLAAQVHVFPVLELPGDVEGFGMVALEAAANGLPTVAFSVGGVPDAVDEPASGELVRPGDYPGFSAAVVGALVSQCRSRNDAIRFASGKSWSHFAERARQVVASHA